MNILVFFAGIFCVSQFIDACNIEVKYVDDAFKDQIVNKHNELRAKIANGEEAGFPPASNMQQMKWDDQLAEMAQEIANKCSFDYDTENENAGQSNYLQVNRNDEPDWEALLKSIVSNEDGNFNADNIGSYQFQLNSADFTQVIWAETNKVGCGYVRYSEEDKKLHLYVCLYLPQGNVNGESVYEVGDPCSSCGGCGPIQGLCSNKSRRRRSEDEDEEEEEEDEEEEEEDDDEEDEEPDEDDYGINYDEDGDEDYDPDDDDEYYYDDYYEDSEEDDDLDNIYGDGEDEGENDDDVYGDNEDEEESDEDEYGDNEDEEENDDEGDDDEQDDDLFEE